MSIVEICNEVEPHLELLALVSVRAAKNSEALEPRQDVFYHQTLLGQKAVFSFGGPCSPL
jgi:hypothetical protein